KSEPEPERRAASEGVPYKSQEPGQEPVNHGLLQFGEFELDCARYELRRRQPKRPALEGVPYNEQTLRTVKLEKIPMDLLILLAESGGRLVTREEIEERLWGKDVFCRCRAWNKHGNPEGETSTGRRFGRAEICADG